ncbi:hypothetical protein FB45DRAFT_1055467 [Roridomyces roridus]|uniref:Uncharacterized protein n=1 Tax=Roridomyces roridus TaxID=1738132 RepID=A0AAD7FRS1_9AGAR|nr:hypothetical protein FB45DRAFT_1055467 [Roridomyces roridus]
MSSDPEPRIVWVTPYDTEAVRTVFPLPLPGTDRINFEVSLTNTVPGPIEEERFLKAFKDALTYYPHTSGRLRTKGRDWTIGHGKRGVPVAFVETDEPFNHYEYLQAPPARMIDTCVVDISGASEPEWDEPLMRVKMTYCRTTNETILGCSYCHMLGDGEFIHQFIYAVSQYYQGKKPAFGTPTWEKLNDNPSTADFIDRFLPHLKVLYPMDEWMGMVGGVMGSTSQVDIMFTAQQIEQFRAVADTHPGRKGTKSSAQDALSAYVITTLNRVLPTPITKVSSMLSYRGVANPKTLGPDEWRIPGSHAVGNAIFQAFTDRMTVDEASSIGSIALVIRQSLKDTRNYEHIKRIIAVSEPIWQRQSQEAKEHKFWSDDGTFALNSMPKCVSITVLKNFHFGYGPERTRCVFYGAYPGFARFFQAPPSQHLDGTWDSNEGAMVMFVRVPTVVRDKFVTLIAEDLLSASFPRNLLWREKKAQERAQAAGQGKAKL